MFKHCCHQEVGVSLWGPFGCRQERRLLSEDRAFSKYLLRNKLITNSSKGMVEERIILPISVAERTFRVKVIKMIVRNTRTEVRLEIIRSNRSIFNILAQFLESL